MISQSAATNTSSPLRLIQTEAIIPSAPPTGMSFDSTLLSPKSKHTQRDSDHPEELTILDGRNAIVSPGRA